MPKKTKDFAGGKLKACAYYGLRPWRCERRDECFELVAYVEAKDRWETVATIHPTSAAKVETIAGFIIGLVNQRHEGGDVLKAALRALSDVLDEGLNFTTEQDAERVVERLKRLGIQS